MDNKEFKKILRESLAEYDFIYKNKDYYYLGKELIIIINCQKSNFDNAYYVNYGFWVKDIHNEKKLPSIIACDIMGRFSYILGDKREYYFHLDVILKYKMEYGKYNITNYKKWNKRVF